MSFLHSETYKYPSSVKSETVGPSKPLPLFASIPILAIRAVQAGALTSGMDREPHPSGMDKADFIDFERALPFRNLANEWGESPASLAHRFALSVEKVSSVVLGVKNRQELQECINAESKGKLSSHEMETLLNIF